MNATSQVRTFNIALAGNPNSGKTTIFNFLTGSTAKVGNWPGVTVERREGFFKHGDNKAAVVDLPGIYSLSADSEDEAAARDYLMSGNVDLAVCILDASNLERNLYLAAAILESGLPAVIALNMMDVAEKNGIQIDCEKLSKSLGCPVLPLSAVKAESLKEFKTALQAIIKNSEITKNTFRVDYGQVIESAIGKWSAALEQTGKGLGVSGRFLALGLLEEDPFIAELMETIIEVEAAAVIIKSIERETGSPIDMIIADSRYKKIGEICKSAIRQKPAENGQRQSRLDKVLMHRIWGIPIFLGIMYLVFWITMNIGGAFIDFFDILFGGLLVDGLGQLMDGIGSPAWLTAIIAGGVGGGIQTVATFIPIIFTMFFMLALLEDSGYMARAAFVMDRAMRAIGLPGKAFVPMLVGFGCTVPAIMATRTLETKRDRFMAIFMTPFMSCGARLPVYALFAAAFFGQRAGGIVFSIYAAGIVLAILTGLLLKNSVFKGAYSPFVMELPKYHAPRLRQISKSAWQRLKIYMIRAGKIIVLVVLVLAFLNSLGADGSFGNEDSEESALSAIGKTITPVFTPMGISKDNWPATVSLFTGLFAKEAVVGTLNALYSQEASLDQADGREEEAEGWNFGAILSESFVSIGEGLLGALSGILDPLGFSMIGPDTEALSEELETDSGVFGGLRDNFSPLGAYVFMLFVLIYFPCVAALGVAIQETGKFYGTVLVTYLTLLAWIVSTLVFQIFEGGQALWIIVPLLLLAGIIISFIALGKRKNKRQSL